MENDSKLYPLAVSVYQRSLQLFNIMCSLIDDQPNYTLKQPFLFKGNKTVFDRQRLKRNSVYLGIYLQHMLIDQLTERAFDISEMAVFSYLTFEHPSASTEEKYATTTRIIGTKMCVFDDIRNMRHPLHVGASELPKKGSGADNEFYRLSVWLIENALLEPTPVFDPIFITETLMCITTWFESAIRDIHPSDFVFEV
jgi:hypothetical protein